MITQLLCCLVSSVLMHLERISLNIFTVQRTKDMLSCDLFELVRWKLAVIKAVIVESPHVMMQNLFALKYEIFSFIHEEHLQYSMMLECLMAS